MTTYEENYKQCLVRYYWDPNIRFWTLYAITAKGDQSSPAEYYGNKRNLLTIYPTLKFKEA